MKISQLLISIRRQAKSSKICQFWWLNLFIPLSNIWLAGISEPFCDYRPMLQTQLPKEFLWNPSRFRQKITNWPYLRDVLTLFTKSKRKKSSFHAEISCEPLGYNEIQSKTTRWRVRAGYVQGIFSINVADIQACRSNLIWDIQTVLCDKNWS